MKYNRKINKHYEYLSQENYLDKSVKPIELLKNSIALLEGCSCNYFASNKKISYLDSLAKDIYNLAFSDLIYGENEELINLYSRLLTALCAYKSVTNLKDCDSLIEKTANFLLSCGDSVCEQVVSENSPYFAKTLSMANGLSEYYALSKSDSAKNLLNKICLTIEKCDIYNCKDSCYDYLTTCLGLIRFAEFTNKSAVNCVIGQLFDNFLVSAQSLNYSSAISFNDKSESDAKATAKSLEVALGLLNNTKDNRYLTIARRIWFNGMQFCQRDMGQVGSDTFTNENTRLKVKQYQIKQITTPLYATGLKCYNLNKGLFEEEGNIIKDRRGRIFLGDKMFAKDVSGFFGKDLIEIPTLTAFDKETNLQLDLQILF